jgi:hypothetical protein
LGDSLKPSVKLAFGTADWFASDTGTSLLFTGNTYPHLSTQTGSAFYYVAVSDNGCMAPARTKVPVRVAQAPAITGLTSPVICSKGTALLQGNVSSGTFGLRPVFRRIEDRILLSMNDGREFEVSVQVPFERVRE